MEISKKLKITTLAILITLTATFSLFGDSNYVVKKGDTLYSISRKYQITVAELRTANNLSESDVLKEGAKLRIPSADIGNAAALSSTQTVKAQPIQTAQSSKGTYTVKAGDTLYGIAKKHDIKLAELLAMNNLDSNSTIKVGQKIVVPGTGSTSVAKTETPATPVKGPNVTVPTNTAGVTWPLSNPSVKKISGKVSGVQLSGADNEPVKVVREGTVMYTGVYRGFGEVVFIQSKTGLIYSYSGLAKVTAKKGNYVTAGSEIGKIGKGNDAEMKFMVFQNGKPVDPAKAPRG